MTQQEGNNNHVDTYTWSCCNDDQTLFLLFYLFFATLSVITWNTLFAKPIRLIAVFIHEWSHAIACWFTCGQVHSIQVWHNEGGVTTYRGGCRCIIVPAGYVGCSLSAMIFVIMSGGRTSATIACGLFTCSLLVALCYSANRLLFYLCLGYSVFNLAICWVEYQWYSPLLQFLILYYGVTIGMFAIADIHEDTVLRDVKGSDAHACSAEVWHCCAPQCIGIQWALLAILFQLVGIWVAMVQMSEECTDLGWLDCINLSMNVDELSWEKNWEFEGWWEQAQETVSQTMQTDNFANGWNR